MILTRRIAGMEGMKNAYNFQSRNLKRRDHLQVLVRRRENDIKLNLEGISVPVCGLN
jgi:hypothetical protein